MDFLICSVFIKGRVWLIYNVIAFKNQAVMNLFLVWRGSKPFRADIQTDNDGNQNITLYPINNLFHPENDSRHWFSLRKNVINNLVHEKKLNARLPENHDERLKLLARVSTKYAKFFRIHKKEYIHVNENYPKMWEEGHWKHDRKERFCPIGKLGFFFGLTSDAALDEMRFYTSNSFIDSEKYCVLIMEMCLNDILYLLEPTVLEMIWRDIGIAPCNSFSEMYLKLMDLSTNNETCNSIGAWARDNGYAGIVFPSARYAQKDDYKQAKRDNLTIIPEIDIVDLGTFFCKLSFAMGGVCLNMEYEGNTKKPWILYTQPNLVLFDNKQLVELKDHYPIYYSVLDIDMTDRIRQVSHRINTRLSDIATYVIDEENEIKIGK